MMTSSTSLFVSQLKLVLIEQLDHLDVLAFLRDAELHSFNSAENM